MLFHPTTTVDILRGSTTDQFGDEVPSDTAVATGVPAVVTETGRRTSTAATAQPRVVRPHLIRLPGYADVQVGDRVKDLGDELVYWVDAVSGSRSFAGAVDLRIEARRVT